MKPQYPLIWLILLLSPFHSFSQSESSIDSLIAIGGTYNYSNPSVADSIYQITLEQATNINYKAGMALSFKGLGVVADVVGDLETSLFHYEKGFETFMEIPDTLGAFKCRFNSGMLYRKLGMYQQAKSTFEETFEVFGDYDFFMGTVFCKINLGITFFDQENYPQALEIFLETKRLAESVNHIDPNIYGNIGNCYLLLDQKDSALYYLDKSYSIAEDMNSAWGMAAYGAALAELYSAKGEFTKAIGILTKVNEICSNMGVIEEVIKTSHQLANNYAQVNNYKEAYKHAMRYAELQDSTRNADFIMELTTKEEFIENQKSQGEIGLLKEQEKNSKLESQKKDLINQGLIAGGTLVFIIAILLFIQSKKRRALNHSLTEKNAMIEEQHKEITDSINYAQQIQTALLTSDLEWNKISQEHFISFKPKDVVSGDFFWAYHSELNNMSIWVAADCTGHGVPGAFMSMLGIGFLNEIIVENHLLKTDQILNELRSKIMKALAQKDVQSQRKDGMDMAICVWDKAKNTLEYSGANNPIYIVRSQGNIEDGLRKKIREENEDRALLEFKPDKMPVGMHSGDLIDFTSTIIELKTGDVVFSFSDGLPDQFGGENGKKFKYRQFREILLANAPLKMADQKDKLESRFEEWRGEFEQIDDICVIGVKI